MPQQLTVQGTIRYQTDATCATGAPAARLLIKTYDRDMRREELVGEKTTDEHGAYRITYTADQFRRAEKRSADLFIRVFSETGDQLAQSDILFNAPPGRNDRSRDRATS